MKRPPKAEKTQTPANVRGPDGVEILALPPAKRACYMGMTADGKRYMFPTLLGMLRWAERMPGVEALCVDVCCWRSYRSFRALQAKGCPVELAYELADLYDGRPEVKVIPQRYGVPHARVASAVRAA